MKGRVSIASIPARRACAPTAETLREFAMNPTKTLAIGLLLAATALFALVACGESEPAPTVTVAGTVAPAPDTNGAAPSAAVASPTAMPAPTATPAPTVSAAELHAAKLLPPTTPAPGFRDVTSWINTEPFTLEDQRGKVVLIDFWTYTCINCIRTLPYIKSWHSKYADSGLVIVGVHAPEFEFEKDRQNVIDAMEKFGLEYAVFQDNDFGTWRNYNNRYWPAKYLIDKDGFIRYMHFGEGKYQETEDLIRVLLEDAGADLSGISPESAPEPVRDSAANVSDPSMLQTRELYAGFERNFGALQSQSIPPYILHPEYYEEINADILYTDPGDHQNQFLYLHGLWRNEAERLVHARQTEGYDDYVALKFYGTSVNVVLGIDEGEPYTVRVTLDDRPLTDTQAGVDVMFGAEGDTYVLVDESRMYNLINLPEYGGSELKLSSESDEFAVFAFTFGAYEGGEPQS